MSTPADRYIPPLERRRRWQLKLLMLVALIGFGWLARWIMSRPPAVHCPPGVRAFDTVDRVPVTLENLVGAVGYQSLTFVSLKSGEIAATIRLVERPRKNGRVYLEETWDSGIWFVGDGQAFLELPKDAAIVKFLILVRPLRQTGTTPDEPWRVWEIDVATVFGREETSIPLPTYAALPLFDSRGDAHELFRRAQAASLCADETQK
jgi:hypothetical protein